MKVIIITDYQNVHPYFTSICKSLVYILFYKNGKYHRDDGAALIYKDGNKFWFYEGKYKGINNAFTNKSWKIKVEKLKRKELLQIFI